MGASGLAASAQARSGSTCPQPTSTALSFRSAAGGFDASGFWAGNLADRTFFALAREPGCPIYSVVALEAGWPVPGVPQRVPRWSLETQQRALRGPRSVGRGMT